jgi:hypothetical protein
MTDLNIELEGKIQRCHKIIESIDGSIKGLEGIRDLIQDSQLKSDSLSIADTSIYDWSDPQDLASRIKEEHLEDVIKETHNYYVDLLYRWQCLNKTKALETLEEIKRNQTVVKDYEIIKGH